MTAIDDEKTFSYVYLVRRALKITLEFVVILLLLYFLPEIITLFRFLYGF